MGDDQEAKSVEEGRSVAPEGRNSDDPTDRRGSRARPRSEPRTRTAEGVDEASPDDEPPEYRTWQTGP